MNYTWLQFSLKFRKESAARRLYFGRKFIDLGHFVDFSVIFSRDLLFFLTKIQRELYTLTQQLFWIDHAIKSFFALLGVRRTRWICQIRCIRPAREVGPHRPGGANWGIWFGNPPEVTYYPGNRSRTIISTSINYPTGVWRGKTPVGSVSQNPGANPRKK